MLNIESLIWVLRRETEFQETIRSFEYMDYLFLITRAIKRLYVDTGRALLYNEDMFIEEEGKHYFNAEIKADESDYVLICAKLNFYDIVSKYYSDMVSYTTNALTMANGDKPYKNLIAVKDELEKERRKLFYRMTRFIGDGLYDL